MKKALFFATLLSALYACQSPAPKGPRGLWPDEDFWMARNYPDEGFAVKAWAQALEQARTGLAFRDFTGFDEQWVTRGPGNIGSRINTIAVNPQNENIVFVGFCRGGVWRTANGGLDWEPVFDSQPFLAIGDIEFDPTNPDVIYVGTGDPNISSHPGIGNGVYKSVDGGDTWAHLGLEDQRIISKVLVNPVNPNIVYAAAMGLPFERNNDRGLYRSVDGGQHWEQVLFISNQAGIIDLVMNPANPNVLYAAGWDRIRNNTESTIVGPGAKVYKTANGGDTWDLMDNGLPQEESNRIGLAVAPSNPNVVYALYVGTNSDIYNIYKTSNNGESWAPLLDPNTLNGLPDDVLGGFGWYFAKIRVNPADEHGLFVLGVDLWRTEDGGASWQESGPPWFTYEVHADKHDLVYSPSGDIFLATDGGLYRSTDGGFEWEDAENIPATQFYRIAYNPHLPSWYYGGAQDNGTSGGPVLDFEWPRLYGGDGFQPAFRPDMPNVMYAETQNGGIVVSTDGGSFWQSATSGIQFSDRRDWDMPYFISPHNPDVLYTGTYRVYRSTSGVMPQWEPISSDLSDGLVLNARYHVITTLDESPQLEGLLYAGTVDANVWRSDNGGNSWVDIRQGLPERYVTSVKASPDFPDWVYVANSGYKDNDFIPHLHRSKNRGQNWEDISGNLPGLAVNDVLILPGHQDTVLFAATDGGVYGSMDAGANWQRLGSNMPYVQSFDLVWNEARNELVAGTFARSIMSYPLDSLFAAPMDTTVVDIPLVEHTPSFIKLYPSPATDWVQAEFSLSEPGKGYQLAVLDGNGRLVLKRNGKASGRVQERLNVKQLPAGMYTVKVKLGQTVRVGRFVKR
ncbi:MAG: T9SS type A sorting domain-containing protein [Phaeodactylibacter sp.]|nr:T9SS type A sorting domain-containing protein [Phaeodactylibacter sp.]MCB9275931.1 T9SS type A sorting domain-containing protein [Lewinellaceae bacterium]